MPVRVQPGKQRHLIQEIGSTGEGRAEKSNMKLRVATVRSHCHPEAKGTKGGGRRNRAYRHGLPVRSETVMVLRATVEG